jgi:hypothetical protein
MMAAREFVLLALSCALPVPSFHRTFIIRNVYVNDMRETTQQMIAILDTGVPVELFLIQNSWIQGGGEVEVGQLQRPDLIIQPSYYQKFKDAAEIDPTAVTYDQMEADLDMLAKMMRTAYQKMMGGSLQLMLE